MEKIIQKAIEGGWRKDITVWDRCTIDNEGFYATNTFEEDIDSTRIRKEWIVCDPLFWQALGKACGWNGMIFEYAPKDGSILEPNEWINYALRFHEINLTQGFDSAVAYLQDLTNQ
jgi:hypothetical protein